MRQERHIWGHEQRRDSASEWPSTMSSTLSAELRDGKPARARRKRRRATYVAVAAPFLLALAFATVFVLAISHRLHG